MANTATTQLGNNSWVIAYAVGVFLSEIQSAVQAVMTSAGWTVHDALAGTNAVCYKAINADGATYKYVVFDFNTAGSMFLKVYETWNASNHTGTNICSRATDTTYQQALNLTTDKGLIYIFANSHYVAVIIRQYSTAILGNNSVCGATGCFEFARDNPDDTTALGYPNFCFLNTGILGEGSAGGYETVSIPRTRSGASGVNQYGEISTIWGKTLYSTPFRLNSFLPTTVSMWSNKDWAVSLYVQDGTVADPSVRGRIEGLKAFTQSRLYFMDKIQVPCDALLNYDPNGTLTDHYVIPGGHQGAGLYTVRFLIPA